MEFLIMTTKLDKEFNEKNDMLERIKERYFKIDPLYYASFVRSELTRLSDRIDDVNNFIDAIYEAGKRDGVNELKDRFKEVKDILDEYEKTK